MGNLRRLRSQTKSWSNEKELLTKVVRYVSVLKKITLGSSPNSRGIHGVKPKVGQTLEKKLLTKVVRYVSMMKKLCLENSRLQMGHLQTGHFETPRFQCSQLQRLD